MANSKFLKQPNKIDKNKFPDGNYTGKIVNFLLLNNFKEISDVEDYKESYKKLVLAAKKDYVFMLCKDDPNDKEIFVKFCNKGKVSEDNPILCITTTYNGKKDIRTKYSYSIYWTEFPTYYSNVKIEDLRENRAITIYKHDYQFNELLNKYFNWYMK